MDLSFDVQACLELKTPTGSKVLITISFIYLLILRKYEAPAMVCGRGIYDRMSLWKSPGLCIVGGYTIVAARGEFLYKKRLVSNKKNIKKSYYI